MGHDKRILIIADHASNFIPKGYNNLNLPKELTQSHIAYDLGVKSLSIKISKKLKSSLILGEYSRLLIDNNRDIKDPTLISEISDRKIIKGNVKLSKKEKLYRINEMYMKYHRQVNNVISKKKIKFIISIHSFNPIYKGNKRDIEIGILSNRDKRLTHLIINELQRKKITVGDNKPYIGNLIGDTLFKHALNKNLLHALIEVRNDLLLNNDMIEKQAQILFRAINSSISKISFSRN